MNKKQIILAGVGGVLVVVLGVYFFAVPNMQVASYKDVVGKKHSELNDSLNKLGTILDSDTFIKTDVEAATIRSDVKRGTELSKDVETKLGLVKKDLTSFNSLPLLDFNSKYKTAQSLKTDEVAYVSKTEAFVAELKQTLDYMDKNADLDAKSTEFSNALSKAGEAESLTAYADILDKAVKDLQPALDEFSKLTPTASLKESHEYAIKATNELIDLLKQMSAAARSGDENKMSDIANKILTKYDEVIKKSDEYNAKFIRESDLRKLDDALNQLDRDIIRKQASL